VSDAAWWVLGGGLAGLIVGSFIATLVIRWPLGRALDGRSVCDACKQTLGVGDLIPVLSFLLMRGRCRHCGVAIDARHLAVELAAGLVGALVMIAAPGLSGVAGAVFGWQLLTLAALDAEHFWLPERLTSLLAATGLVTAVLEQDMLRGRLIGGVAGFAALFLIAWGYKRLRGREGLGTGDPKLLGAIGLWLGWQALPLVLVAASGVGLIAALLMRLRGQSVGADTRLPLGTLMAVAAFPLWIWAQH
jgi:leader peptidase (prepilin peptidase) / N-methyltransferase